MLTEYTIYLKNNSSTTQQFWCFLARPEELASDPDVFANSSASLSIASMYPGVNTFTIPVQYSLGAGASNSAVGLNVRIDSNITQNTDLGQAWEASYVTVPPNQGPSLKQIGAAEPGKISIRSNAFHQASNEANGWFSNMSYGLRTKQGFIGMTWSPSPQKTRVLTPKLEFYISVGSFGSNALASWTDVSNSNQRLTLADFRLNKVTVIYTEIGGWVVEPGEPQRLVVDSHRANLPSLSLSHQLLAQAHANLVGLATRTGSTGSGPGHHFDSGTQEALLQSVTWDDSSSARTAAGSAGFLRGTLTLRTALFASFAAFILAGLRFIVTFTSADGLQVAFSYSGDQPVEFVKSLFAPGALLEFLQRQGALSAEQPSPGLVKIAG